MERRRGRVNVHLCSVVQREIRLKQKVRRLARIWTTTTATSTDAQWRNPDAMSIWWLLATANPYAMKGVTISFTPEYRKPGEVGERYCRCIVLGS